MSRLDQDAVASSAARSEPFRGVGVDRHFFERDALAVAPQLLGSFVTSHILGEGMVTVRVTEVEAYHGLGTGTRPDPGSHARMGQTPRNSVMFGEPGHVYVYQSYGIHSAANLVCSPAGVASGVLLRAGEIVEGVEIARARRIEGASLRDLARGPGRLAQALGLFHNVHNGTDAMGGDVVSLRLDPAYAYPSLAGAEGTPVRTVRGADGGGAPARVARGTDERLDADAPGSAGGSALSAGDRSVGSVASGPRVGVSGVAGSAEYPWRFWIAGDPTVSAYRPGKNVPPESA